MLRLIPGKVSGYVFPMQDLYTFDVSDSKLLIEAVGLENVDVEVDEIEAFTEQAHRSISSPQR